MTTKHKIVIDVFICISAIILVSGYSVWRVNHSNSGQLSKVIVAGNTIRTTVPIVPDPVSRIDTASQPTPDGTKKIVMEATHNNNGTLTYIFTSTDGSGNNVQPLFDAVVQASASASEGMNVPFNAWSPDNKYVFIQKNDGNALVFKATGEEIIPGQYYLDVKDVFNASGKKDTYHETTGWASPTLLIVNTFAPDNTKGSSYWFEVPSKAIIQLSSSF
ncbi:MAG: hypothetical protein Q8L37_01350 [Candidatus Gottesmanbacteria bacterium]|nr:hypothetical protein [Candidatus Gottesmanbacteria bacterium]